MPAELSPEPFSEPIDPGGGVGIRGRYVDLGLVSFLILFLELASIRWFGSTIQFLTFFTNLVLLASFLGMSVGLLTAEGRRDYLRTVLPLALGAVGTAMVAASSRVSSLYKIVVGEQRSPQQVFFGTERFAAPDPSQFVVPIEVAAAFFFVVIALMFVGLGQVMGRAFNALPNRIMAYTVDILGSLAGIAVFALLSWLRTPPPVWFAVAMIVALRFFPRLGRVQAGCAVALVGLLGLWGYRDSMAKITIWSPYYKIYFYEKYKGLVTNNIGHQNMVSVGETGAAYFLPHLLNRDAGNGPFGRVLIVGAGSGNDVAAALRNGAERVDAVEIEPVLNEFGRDHHPLRPYDDPRVTITLDDGRSFVRRSDRTFDLIAYALVDSLVLHSGYSSLRLESFLFTEQAFRDVKARLADDGVFVMSNYYRQGWIVGRLVEMARRVFGVEPIVLSLPYRPGIRATDSLLGGEFTIILVGKPGSKSLESIRAKLAATPFWLSGRPFDNKDNGYTAAPPMVPGIESARWQRIGPAQVDTAGIGPLPSDDWPFLYLKEAAIPALNLRGMALIAVLSLVILVAFAPGGSTRPDGRMFFLGAGFMLLESKGVVHMALLFGSTWVVNSIVFGAILVMILVSNLFVLGFRPRRLAPYYAGLLAALLINALVPMSTFLALPGVARVAVSCLVVGVPVFFAGVIFATSFAASRRPDVAFGSNVAGVILGGLSENLSLVLGFDRLLLVAVGFYLLSAVFGSRTAVSGASA